MWSDEVMSLGVTGPIFFAWLCQLLLPIMLVAIVYEKQFGLRIMMKMHGLGEAAYFTVQYLWFLALYCAYIVSTCPPSTCPLALVRLLNRFIQSVAQSLWAQDVFTRLAMKRKIMALWIKLLMIACIALSWSRLWS